MQTKPRWWVRNPYFFIKEPKCRADIVLDIGFIESNAIIADVFEDETEGWQVAEKYIKAQITEANEILDIFDKKIDTKWSPPKFLKTRWEDRLSRAKAALAICQEVLSTKA